MTKAESVKPPTLGVRVRRSSVWNLATTIMLRISNILLTAVIAHILAPRDFGAYAVSLTAFAIISAIGEFGVASCLIRADFNMNALAPTMATISLATSAVLAVAMAAFAEPIAAMLGSSYAAGPVRVMSLAVMLTGIMAVPGAQLIRDFRQDKLFLANAISFFPSTLVLVFLAKSGGGAMAFAWSRVTGQFVVGLIFVLSVDRNYWPGIRRGALDVFVKFGLPLAAANFVNFILVNVDYALIGRFMGAIALGTYVLAFNVSSWPSSLLGTVINNVAMPAFSRVKQDAGLLRHAVVDAVRLIAFVVMPMCAVIMALARPLVATLYGPKWTGSANVLSFLTIYAAIALICVLVANVISSMGHPKLLLGIQLIWLGVLTPAMMLGVHYDGIVGASFAHIAVIGPIVLPCYLIALKRATGVGPGAVAGAILPALVAGVIAGVVAKTVAAQFISPLVQLMAGGLVGGLLYALIAIPQFLARLKPAQRKRLLKNPIFRGYMNVARTFGLSPLSDSAGTRPVNSPPYRNNPPTTGRAVRPTPGDGADMRGRRRRDDGWDEGRDRQGDGRRDPWAGENGYHPDTAGYPAAGYANGAGYRGQNGYAGQNGYGNQAPGSAAHGHDARGYESRGFRHGPKRSGGSPDPGYPGTGQAAAYLRAGLSDAGYGSAGYPGSGFAANGYGASGYGGYAQGGSGPDAGYARDAGGAGYGGQWRAALAATSQDGWPSASSGPGFLPAEETGPGNEGAAGTPRPYGRLSIFTLLDYKAAEFDRLAERAAEGVRTAEPDTLVYVIQVVPKAPMQRIIYEIYRDRAAFESHEQQPHIQRFVADRRSCVIATNIIDLRLKYAKVAALGTAQVPSAPASGPETQLDRGAAAAGSAVLSAAAPAGGVPGAPGQWYADRTSGQYPGDWYSATAQHAAGSQYPAASGQYGGGRYGSQYGGDQDAAAANGVGDGRQQQGSGRYPDLSTGRQRDAGPHAESGGYGQNGSYAGAARSASRTRTPGTGPPYGPGGTEAS